MAHEDSLSSVLSEFARTLVTDFPIQGILDRLVERIVGVLEVSGAGVTLISPGAAPHYIAASDEAALRFERLQTEHGEGPCLTAYRSGKAVAIPDLAENHEYPTFGPAAVAAGMAAVFTFPLWHGEGRLGALDLYRDTVGLLGPEAMASAQTLADVAAAYLINAQARQEALDVSNRFRESALHDALTGLPNRALLQQRIEHAAQRAQRSHGTVAVLFADLDRFKRVNDSYGHGVGDELLISVGRRMAAVVRPGDTLARVSGDEFVFLCEDLADVKDVERLATRIEEVFGKPFVLSRQEISITASVGIAYSGPGEAVTNQLVVDADNAMYQAKRLGGAYHRVIDLRAAQISRDHESLEHDLTDAMAGHQLDLAYQPIVRTDDGLVVGVEALLRWTHPRQGPVAALTTVSIAESHGLIIEIGAWVLQRACRERGRWLAGHPSQPLDLSVNVSVHQLMTAGFFACVESVIADTGMDPGALVLEVTEGIFIEDGERALTVLADLRRLGVRVALDDFGTGYSSMAYLSRFPVDILKLDQAFFAANDQDVARAAVVEAVAGLAHKLGLAVTAEGVETEQQRVEVVAVGCELAQGYLYAQPMNAEAVMAQLVGSAGGRLRLPLAAG